MSRLRIALSVALLAWPLAASAQQGDQPAPGSAESGYTGNSGFEAFKKNRLQGFASYKEQVHKEFQQFAKLHDQVSARYEKRISDVWAQPEQSSKTRWVHYEDGYRIKRVVDFEQQQIVWSTPQSEAGSVDLTKSKARQMLQALMAMTRRDAFEQDEVAREVEEKSRSQFKHLETATLDDTSPVLPAYLFGENRVNKQQQQQAINAMLAGAERTSWTENGQQVVGWVLPLTAGAAESAGAKPEPAPTAKPETKPAPKPVPAAEPATQAPAPTPAAPVVARTEGSVWKVHAIEPGQREQLPARARPFVAAINKENREFELSAELLLAIMETESAFNPMAKSSIPAFGLMQIVPASAGQDATEKLFGKPRLLAPSYLYNADNNIRVGAAYFNILYYRYFKGIENPVSRLYCAIAAYNTGPGNVSLALTGKGMKLRPAIAVANTMTPAEVYHHLLGNLPYEETVNYLKKVTTRLDNYTEALNNG
ncbi:transglycosylase SLT domain-containing protein [Marinobacter sp. VGCF2001]|uniref:transglycosylase SLT domain-containing protein n=1 Tax=Marinobacter sp. VGCF2001 TaxID=3417189 RepID=UPI003CF7191C